jgi:uncharacterized membrane protein YraQ (UPF0718 family)
MERLILSTAALVVGPFLQRAFAGARWAMAALDGFVLLIVCGVVLGQLLPHAYAEGGWLALVVAAGGYWAVRQLERAQLFDGQHAHDAALLLGLIGFACHEFFDGVALIAAGHEHPASHLLLLAIVLHRMPIGLAVWWLLRPRLGRRWAMTGLAIVAAATVLGYAVGAQIPEHFGGQWTGLLQGLASGALLHVVTHGELSPDDRQSGWSLAAGVGGLCALGLLGLFWSDLLPPGRGGEAGMARTFLLLALESAPALLIAYSTAGLVGVFLPHAGVAWMRRGPALMQAVRGVAFGLPLPLCSCGVLPVYRSLIARGAPAVAAMAFLVAAPELGIDAVLLSFPLLGLRLTLARLLCATLVALCVGVLVGRTTGSAEPDGRAPALPAPPAGTLGQRVRAALQLGLVETVDHTGPWIVLGLAIAAAIEPLVRPEWLTRLPAGWDVPLFALLGMPMYVCASAATPLVAVLVHKGISPGAAMAFLLVGPATNVTTLGILAQLHGRRVAAWFALVIAMVAMLLGWLTNFVVGDLPGYPFHVGHQHTGPLHPLCLGVLILLLGASFVRQGPRGFLAQLSSMGEDADGHDHAHHGHAHGHHGHAHHGHAHGHAHPPFPADPF